MKTLALLTSFLVSVFMIEGPSVSVDLRLLNDTIITAKGQTQTKFRFRLTNNSDVNQIFYRLNSTPILSKTKNIESYCDPQKTGAGLAIFLFNEDSTARMPFHWYVNDKKNEMTKSRFDSIHNESKRRSLNATMMVSKNNIVDVEQTMNLKDFRLERGKYFIQLMYFSGHYISDFANEEQIKSDRIKYSAEIFQGCLLSNKAILIVE